jgi:hypothetical protein
VKTRFALPLIAVTMIVLCPLFATGEESSWKFPNLNPFASKGQPPTTSRASGAKSAAWRMPKLWPKSTPARKPTQQPSTMQKMTTGTKQFFSKTADALNPWDDANDNQVRKASGSNSAFSQATKKKKPDESSNSLLPASWWSSEDKDSGRDKDVNAFLSRPRPGY